MRMYMQAQKKKYLNNFGFSLLELMVTIAIMAVLIGGSLTTYRIVSKTNVKKATKYIDDYFSLARERAKTIAAYEWNMTIDASGDDVVVQLVKINEKENGEFERTVLDTASLPSNIKVKIVDTRGGTTYLSKDPRDIKTVSFAFTPLKGNVSKIYYNNDFNRTISLEDGSCDIVAYYGDKKSRSVKLYYVTGKHMEVY